MRLWSRLRQASCVFAQLKSALAVPAPGTNAKRSKLVASSPRRKHWLQSPILGDTAFKRAARTPLAFCLAAVLSILCQYDPRCG